TAGHAQRNQSATGVQRFPARADFTVVGDARQPGRVGAHREDGGTGGIGRKGGTGRKDGKGKVPFSSCISVFAPRPALPAPPALPALLPFFEPRRHRDVRGGYVAGHLDHFVVQRHDGRTWIRVVAAHFLLRHATRETADETA